MEHNYGLGAGASAGLLANLTPRWKVHGRVRDIYYGLGDDFNAFEAALQQSFTINPDQSLTFDLIRRKTRDVYQTEARLAWNVFF